MRFLLKWLDSAIFAIGIFAWLVEERCHESNSRNN